MSDLRAFEDGFYPYLESAQASILTDIATKKALDDDMQGASDGGDQGLQGDLPRGLKDKEQRERDGGG